MQDVLFSSLPVNDLISAITKNVIEGLKPLVQATNDQSAPQTVKYITRKDVSKIIGASLPTVLEYTKQGVLTGYRIGRKVRYIESEVFESLKKMKTA